jgi:hypothetical protein
MRTAFVVLSLAACHGAPPPAQPAVAASHCKTAADHLVELMPGSAEAPPDKIKEIHDLIAGHCESDHWSAEAQQCLIGMKGKADGEKCEKLLTPEQADALVGSIQPNPAAPAAPEAGPAPPPPPTGARRSPESKPAKRDSDPCEGGQ